MIRGQFHDRSICNSIMDELKKRKNQTCLFIYDPSYESWEVSYDGDCIRAGDAAYDSFVLVADPEIYQAHENN